MKQMAAGTCIVLIDGSLYLLRPNLAEALREAAARGLSVRVLTFNAAGLALVERIVNWMRQYCTVDVVYTVDDLPPQQPGTTPGKKPAMVALPHELLQGVKLLLVDDHDWRATWRTTGPVVAQWLPSHAFLVGEEAVSLANDPRATFVVSEGAVVLADHGRRFMHPDQDRQLLEIVSRM